jgi:UDP-2,3-diacylglucosamine pyrophosphatase LpxH
MAAPVVEPQYDTLILSDLHLGADMSRAREALQVLQNTHYRRLILLGDIFADLNFGRLKKEHWKFLGFIRKLSNPKRHVEVVWVEGNHDLGLAEIMSHLVGVRVYQKYQWNYLGMRHIAVHGHQFDSFVVKNVRFNYWFGTLLYLQLQKWDTKSKALTRFLDRLGTRWQRLSEKVADGALAHARHYGAARIFCGHTHVAQHKHSDGADYYNSGAWIDERLTYLTVGEDGVQIHEYDGPFEFPDHDREIDQHAGALTASRGGESIYGADERNAAEEYDPVHSEVGEHEGDSDFADFVEDGEYENVGR